MGSTFAMDLAEGVKTKLQLENAVRTHLLYNHYPPLPSSMVGPCVRAIEYANRGEYDKKVRLPEGMFYKGKRLAPVDAVIEAHHLEFFLDEDDEWQNWLLTSISYVV